MIDTELVEKACPVSDEIKAIDTSWRAYTHKIKSAVFELPFKGKYKAVMNNDSLLIEGYSGKLEINKLIANRNTYLLTKPIICEPFQIYGIWDHKARFSCFTSEPVLGFHYLGIERNGMRSICTGELEYKNPTDLASLEEISARIMESFKVINTGSLGDIFIPDEYARIKEILKSSIPRAEQIQQLLLGDWIKILL